MRKALLCTLLAAHALFGLAHASQVDDATRNRRVHIAVDVTDAGKPVASATTSLAFIGTFALSRQQAMPGHKALDLVLDTRLQNDGSLQVELTASAGQFDVATYDGPNASVLQLPGVVSAQTNKTVTLRPGASEVVALPTSKADGQPSLKVRVTYVEPEG